MEIFPNFLQTTEIYGNYFQKGELTKTPTPQQKKEDQLETFPMEIYDTEISGNFQKNFHGKISAEISGECWL